MSDAVFTLAVWDVSEARWIAALTSAHRERIDAVFEALSVLVPAFLAVVEIERDDVELIEREVASLPPVLPQRVFAAYFQIVQRLSEDRRSFSPEGGYSMPDGGSSVH